MVNYVIGNLKMNLKTLAERERYFQIFKKEISGKKFKNTKIILCPPFVHIESFVSVLSGKYVSIGAQDVFWEKEGAFTGEVSAAMLKNLKAEYVIIGHSERRKYFGETTEISNLKIKAAIKAGLSPVYCVGEKREERDNGIEQEIIETQIERGLAGVSSSQLEKVIIVYEPIWSVGSDNIPTCNEIMEMRILIKKILTAKYGSKSAQKMHILYGGSVSEKTACKTCNEPGANGVLVGRESLSPHDFIKVAEIVDQC